jgi:hypothetical protein
VQRDPVQIQKMALERIQLAGEIHRRSQPPGS